MSKNNENITELWFLWFYKNWEQYSPGDLLEKGILPAQIAERFVNDFQDDFLEFSKGFDDKNYCALEEFMKLSETELLIIKYFLKLVKFKNFK